LNLTLLQVKPGTSPDDVESAFGEMIKMLRERFPDMAEEEEPNYVLSEWEDGWVMMTEEENRTVDTFIQPETMKRLAAGLSDHSDKPAVLSMAMTEEFRTELRNNAQDPQAPPFMVPLFNSLAEMNTTVLGLTLGDEPNVLINMNFDTAEEAAACEAAIQQASTAFLGFMMMMSAGGEVTEEQQKQQQAIIEVVTSMLPKQHKSQLTSQVTLDLFRKLNDMGIDWADADDADTADETEGANEGETNGAQPDGF
jgi:hypothetical protein